MNAKKELQSMLEWKSILCAKLTYNPTASNKTIFILRSEYTEKSLNIFIDSLDFEYDDWFWIQYLFWFVWFTDWTWLSRYEYDGSEEYYLHIIPDIPEECKY